jgi:hypothetical protein
MTIRIPDGVHRTDRDLGHEDDPQRDDTFALARELIAAHPVERERRLRDRLNDPDRRDEYVTADVFGDNVHDLFWGVGPATRAVSVVGGAAPMPLHIGNYTQTLGSYKPNRLDRYPETWWAMFAARFARNADQFEEIKRRRLKFAPDEWTRLDTLEDKGGDYGAPDWVHRSEDPQLVIYELDWTHGWTGLRI